MLTLCQQLSKGFAQSLCLCICSHRGFIKQDCSVHHFLCPSDWKTNTQRSWERCQDLDWDGEGYCPVAGPPPWRLLKVTEQVRWPQFHRHCWQRVFYSSFLVPPWLAETCWEAGTIAWRIENGRLGKRNVTFQGMSGEGWDHWVSLTSLLPCDCTFQHTHCGASK